MNEQDYYFLQDLYRIKNITRVAQLHYLSQPAMTKRIRRIEEELGCQLVLRSKRGITFTPAGELVVRHSREMTQRNDQLRAALNQLQGVVGGTLSFGVSLNYSRYRLPAALRRYQELYPLVDIEVMADHSDDLYQLMLDHQLLVAIIRGAHPWPEGCIRLSSEPLCLVCSRENVSRPLGDYPYIRHQSDSDLSQLTEQWLIERGLSPAARLCVNDIASCRELAAAGVGWSIIPSICLDGFDGSVTPLRLADGTPLERRTYVLYRHSQIELPQVKCFFDVLQECEHGGRQTAAPSGEVSADA